jgi:RimJ/RimL family protein N-acetyltransferase
MIVATPRLLLREFVLEDWAAVLAYQSDPHYLHYYP